MQTTKQISKRILSLMLSALMVVTMLPTFVFSSPTTAEAQDAPASSYWSILASTDFTKTNGKWSGTGDTVTLDNADTKTSAGGSAMGWTIKYADRHGVSGAEVDSNGVSIPWENSNHKTNGFLYMSKFNDQTTNTIFNGVDNFKIDLAFSYLGDSKACTGYELNERRGGTPLIKLAKDSKYSFNSKYTDQANFFCQEAWGRRSVDDDYYKTDGESGTADDSNGPYAISTYNSRSVISANTVYHYVVYYVDKMIGCYVTDDSGNVIINYNPIEMGSYNMAASVITSIYLGGSEFNWAGKYDLENIAYKSIEIYKGVDTHTYDSSRDKFLYAYFTGNDEAGETMHYAISQDGVNFEAVSGGVKVWNPSNYPATETFPTTDSAPNTSGVDISNHVRDSYAFIGNDGKDYVISTDLNTNNGDWGNIKNSRFLLWKMDNFADIADTKPISIDTSRLPGMDAITNNSQVKKAWAPQAIWDSDMGKYMLYWSVGADGIDTQLYYTYTSDFKSDFTTVKRLMYPDFAASGITNHIDADITYHNGLYYCYFKNEDGSGTGSKRIWYAVAPNANGPYTDFELINTSYGAEGPQVYETGNGSYMLMIDGYGDGTYHMYSAGTPYDFDISDETTTNVTSLSPRHGSIVRITDAEYQKLKKLRIGEELRYDWQTEGSYAHNTPQTDSTGNAYHVTWNPSASTTTTGNGVLSITDSGMYSDLSTVQNFIASDVYSVTFNYKSNGSTARDDNHSIFSISNSGSVTNYVRLSSNGKFIVNNSQVAVSGNCSDGTTTRASKLSSAVTDTANFHRFTVTSDGLITSLIIDGEFICQTISGMDIPNTLWITFGWARISGVENNRLTAQFGQIVFKNVATDTGKQDELYDSNVPSSLSSAVDAVGKHCGNPAQNKNSTNGYSNVAYCSSTTNFTGEQDKFYCYFKFAMPSVSVIAWDGVEAHKPSVPAVFEIYRNGSHSQNVKCVDCTTTNLSTRVQDWIGYTDKNTKNITGQTGSGYQIWPGSVVASSSDSNYYTISGNKGAQHDVGVGHDSSRYFWNRIYYTSNMNNNTAYTETYSNPSLYTRGYYNSWGGHNEDISWSASGTIYVVNYKSIYDIVKSDSTSYIKVDGAATTTNIYTLFSADANNRWKYSKESYVQAAYAMKLLNDCNPKNFFANENDSTVATRVTQYQAAVEKAITEFNKIDLKTNKFNITYRMADGTTKAEVVTAGNLLANVPAKTADYHIFDSETHKKNCTWTSVTNDPVPEGASAYNPSVTPSTSVQPKANTIYSETGTVENCNHDTACAHVDASGDVNGYTDYKCSVCSEIYEKNRVWDTVDSETQHKLADRWTVYSSKANSIEEKHVSSEYTTDSRGYYFTAATAAISGVTANDPSKSETYINNRISALETAESMLNPLAEYETLLEHKSTHDTNNLDGAGKQKYTFNSWKDFATAYEDGKVVYDSKTAGEKLNIGKFEVNGTTHVVDTTNTTEEQEAIEDANDVTEPAYTALANNVIDNDSYDTYEGARSVIDNSLDSRKYTQAGLDLVNNAIGTADGDLYYTLTGSEITKYGAFAVDGKVKTATAADTQTTDVLSASTTINTGTTYLKTYHLDFTVQRHDKDDPVYTSNTMRYYGESVDLTVPAEQLKGYKVSTWSTSNLDDNYDTENPVSSQKASGRIGSTYTKVIGGNVAVVAELEQESGSQEGLNRYDVYDAYGSLVDVIYSTETKSGTITTQTITFDGGGSATAKDMPFYTFNSWELTTVKANHYKLAPQYEVTQTYDIDIVGASNVTAKSGTVTSTSRIENVVYDTLVTITSSDANFAAWAVKTGANEYQIASYNSTCTFYACADEDYVAIVSDGNGGYQTVDAKPVAITGANIDGAVASGATLTADQKTALVNDKIANHKPFIAIQNIKMTDKQARVYARITQGATGNTGYGVLYKSGNNPTEETFAGATKRTVTSALSTGQFTYTLNSKTTFKVDNVTFRTFVNYPAKYKYNNTDYEINGTDYSEIAVATKNA
ncbi:MAG: hypothetical protein IJ643_01655 [Eubacterium sp.]|nr:hypothetical protein [Eubacterium sp.]